MNKRGIIVFIFVFFANLISFYYMTFTSKQLGEGNIAAILLLGIISLTIFMYQELKHIKTGKIKFVYDIVLILLTIFSLGIVVYICYNMFSCHSGNNCSYDISTIYTIIYIPTLLSILLLNITNVYNKTNKINDYLTIVASIIVLLIYLRFYTNPNLSKNITLSSSMYVAQNYLYFIIMYITIIIHKFINRVS